MEEKMTVNNFSTKDIETACHRHLFETFDEAGKNIASDLGISENQVKLKEEDGNQYIEIYNGVNKYIFSLKSV
jgi:hypothetical protein